MSHQHNFTVIQRAAQTAIVSTSNMHIVIKNQTHFRQIQTFNPLKSCTELKKDVDMKLNKDLTVTDFSEIPWYVFMVSMSKPDVSDQRIGKEGK